MIENKLDKIIELLKEKTETKTHEAIKNQRQRFKNNGNGTITDITTGLMWLKNANHFDKDMEWEESIDACENLNFAGHNDWRLPTVDELLSLIDRSNHDPALPDDHPFKNGQSDYWSASSYVPLPGLAWRVGMSYGDVSYSRKSYNGYVWPVRISPGN